MINEGNPVIEDEPTKTVRGDGTITYRLNGLYHRLDGPALIYSNGEHKWYHHHQLHRLDGPAVTRENGTQEWYRYGLRHRANGPAIIREHSYQWWVDGKLHNSNGPAVIWPDGEKEWWLNGKKQNVIVIGKNTIIAQIDLPQYDSLKLVSRDANDIRYHLDDVDMTLLRLEMNVMVYDYL